MMGVARFLKSFTNYAMLSIQGKSTSSSLFKFFYYSESFMRVFISGNHSPESAQLDIEL